MCKEEETYDTASLPEGCEQQRRILAGSGQAEDQAFASVPAGAEVCRNRRNIFTWAEPVLRLLEVQYAREGACRELLDRRCRAMVNCNRVRAAQHLARVLQGETHITRTIPERNGAKQW